MKDKKRKKTKKSEKKGTKLENFRKAEHQTKEMHEKSTKQKKIARNKL